MPHGYRMLSAYADHYFAIDCYRSQLVLKEAFQGLYAHWLLTAGLPSLIIVAFWKLSLQPNWVTGCYKTLPGPEGRQLIARSVIAR